ncbi:MAG: TPR end-of-group domain-containing protein [Planctomycetota bacterium]
MAKRQGKRRDNGGGEDILREFEIGLARAALAGNKGSFEALQMLGHALTRSGRHREAIAVDRRIVELRPKDPVSHYNLACSYSNLNEADRAFEALERAFDLGYRDVRHMLVDEDLRNVRGDPRFRKLVERRWGRRQSRRR